MPDTLKEKKKKKDKPLSNTPVPTGLPVYKGLFVATPCYDSLTLHYVKSCLDLQKECLMNKINITFQLMKSSLVTQGRNLCVASFLSSNAESMIFIDSDISFSVRSVYRLFSSPYEISMVAYPMKTVNANKFYQDNIKRPSDHPDTKGYVFPVELPDINKINIEKGFCEIKKGPAGCMMIKRSAFDKLIKQYPELTIKQKTLINGKMEDRLNYYNFFDTYWDPKEKTSLGEDFYFCKLWTKMGEKLWCLADEEISHVGEKMYRGSLMQEFKALSASTPSFSMEKDSQDAKTALRKKPIV